MEPVRTRRLAATDGHTPGYYRSLNDLPAHVEWAKSAPMKSRRLTLDVSTQSSLPLGVYSVERIITDRQVKKGSNQIQYLVLWEGYPREEASWVNSSDITEAAVQSYEKPNPPKREVHDCCSNLMHAIKDSLKCGCTRKNDFTVNFRLDCFKVLFDGKGRDDRSRRGCLYELSDFPDSFFNKNWYKFLDKHGEGYEVDFPIRMKPSLKWNSNGFCKLDSGELICAPKTFTEVVKIMLCKRISN